LTDPRTGFARNHRTGHFYISGMYNNSTIMGTLQFGSTQLASSSGGYPMYLAAFDSSGNSLWVKQSDPSSAMNPMLSRPQIDEEGNIYLSGGASPNATFLGHTFINT